MTRRDKRSLRQIPSLWNLLTPILFLALGFSHATKVIASESMPENNLMLPALLYHQGVNEPGGIFDASALGEDIEASGQMNALLSFCRTKHRIWLYWHEGPSKNRLLQSLPIPKTLPAPIESIGTYMQRLETYKQQILSLKLPEFDRFVAASNWSGEIDFSQDNFEEQWDAVKIKYQGRLQQIRHDFHNIVNLVVTEFYQSYFGDATHLGWRRWRWFDQKTHETLLEIESIGFEKWLALQFEGGTFPSLRKEIENHFRSSESKALFSSFFLPPGEHETIPKDATDALGFIHHSSYPAIWGVLSVGGLIPGGRLGEFGLRRVSGETEVTASTASGGKLSFWDLSKHRLRSFMRSGVTHYALGIPIPVAFRLPKEAKLTKARHLFLMDGEVATEESVPLSNIQFVYVPFFDVAWMQNLLHGLKFDILVRPLSFHNNEPQIPWHDPIMGPNAPDLIRF